MKQYLPMKPTKRGFKIWVLADSTNGYFLDAHVYIGREGGVTEHGVGERVVLGLTEKYCGRNHHVFCDNFFTSPRLFRELHSHGLYACGTVRQMRKEFPHDLRNVRQTRGESMFRQSDNLTAVVWQDRRPVHVLSTLSQPGEVQKVSRRERNGSTSEVDCPSAIVTYTKYMGGVDLGDQLRKYYSVRLKCNKNYKYFFWTFFDISITNSFILYKLCTPPTHTSSPAIRLKSFREKLAWSLIGSYNSRQRPLRRLSSVQQHPTPAPAPFHSPHHHPRQRCVYCRDYRNPSCRRESVWQCLACEGAPTLCLTGREDGTDCWALWHAPV